MTGFCKTQFDPNSLPLVNNFHPFPFNPNSPVPQMILPNSSSYLDFSTGISLYSEFDDQISFTFGAALFHFLQNKMNQSVMATKIPREWVFNSGIQVRKSIFSIQMIADLRMNYNSTTLLCALMVGIPIHRNLLEQLTEIQLGINFNSTRELSPSIGIKLPGIVFSSNYNMLHTGTKWSSHFKKTPSKLILH
jgi:hypothetical protein